MRPTVNLSDPQLVKALTHPLRAQILRQLEERTASPSALAEELGAPLGNVAYHVRQLAGLGLIELVRTTPRRGAIEHEYRALPRQSRMSDEAWDRLPSSIRQAMTAALLDEVTDEVVAAAGAGHFDRDDAHVVGRNLDLDEQGWSELAGALTELRERAGDLQAECRERMAQGDRRAALVLMLFERADERAAEPTA